MSLNGANELGMRVAIGQFQQPTDEQLLFARQLGVGGVQLNTPIIPGEKRWEYLDLLRLRTTCNEAGLRLEAIENTPLHFYDKAILGLPGRDEQIENYQETIRNMGRAGIDKLGLHWMANGVWRTSFTSPARGGAKVSSFDTELVANAPLSHEREFTEDEIWANFEYFAHAVVPVAEEAGVHIAIHPDDPPVPSLGGVPRIFRDPAGFKRGILETHPSDYLGIDFCMGTWSEMGPGVIESIEFFGSLGKIFYVHFRDVQGHVPKFQECFLGEGNVNIVDAIRTLRRVGFNGFLIDDHVPSTVNDTPWGHRARAHQSGLITGLMMAVEAMEPESEPALHR